MKWLHLSCACAALTMGGTAQAAQDRPLTFAGQIWRVEAEAASPATTVTSRHGAMEINASGGVTVLLLRKLTGSYCIRYTREVLGPQRPLYRISDLNQFWLIDPSPLDVPVVRDGRFESYTPDHLFYVGIGGNDNTTTRFRHYDGTDKRPLLGESGLRLEAGHRYDVRTCVEPGRTELFVDGKLLFSAAQTSPAASYFALRTTGSKQRITKFRIERR